MLHFLLVLTRSLQAETKDVIQAVTEIKAVMSAIKRVRDEIDEYHAKWFEKITEICDKAGMTPSTPRICSRQSHRSNIAATTPSDYFRQVITIPMVDHLLTELNNRFNDD